MARVSSDEHEVQHNHAKTHAIRERTQPTGEEPADEEGLAIIKTIFALSKDEVGRKAPPTIVGVRLWRILAEWAHAIDPHYSKGSVFLPDVFATFEEVERHKFDDNSSSKD